MAIPSAGDLDSWLVAFLEENWVVLVILVVTLSLAQVYWYLTREPPVFLNPETYQDLPLEMKENVNHNTLFLRFALPDPNQRLGLPIGQHVIFKFTDAEGKNVFRPYTPVSDSTLRGHVDFLIKVYPKGKMSQHVGKLDIGDRIDLKGPKGSFWYRRNMKTTLGMVCGGTGITPMYQVLNHILNDPKDKTRISLVYANITRADILLKCDLERLVARHPTRFDIFYVVEKNVPEGWKGGVGFVTSDILQKQMPPPAKDVMVLRCGPPPMNDAVAKCLNELGYTDEMQFQF